MCIGALKKIFQRETKPELKLPHPEEKPDFTATMLTVDLPAVFNKWVRDWAVPAGELEFWLTVDVQLSQQYNFPELTWFDTKEIKIRPEWANPGVLAHAMAHIAWGQISDVEREEFACEYNLALTHDPLLMYLDSINNYMNTEPTEAHAEIYRYLGGEMPETLKRFYPRLF